MSATNSVERFLADACAYGAGLEVTSGTFRQDYLDWCRANGLYALSGGSLTVETIAQPGVRYRAYAYTGVRPIAGSSPMSSPTLGRMRLAEMTVAAAPGQEAVTASDCQAVLDAGLALERNDLRVYLDGPLLVVQSLDDGWYIEYQVRALRSRNAGPTKYEITSKRAEVFRPGYMPGALWNKVRHPDVHEHATPGEMAAAMVGNGPAYPSEVSKLIPNVEGFRSIVRGHLKVWGPEFQGDDSVWAVATATIALARLGGRANEQQMLDEMALGIATGRSVLQLSRRVGNLCTPGIGPVPGYSFKNADEG